MSEQQVSLPFLLIVVLTLGLATRYLFFTPSSPSSLAGGSRAGRDSTSARRREAAAETILQMFPQADRRAVLWDLARNGGSVQVTSERILAGRLDTPPVTFQPPPPPGSTNAATATPSKPRKPTQPDLITRYNLQSKISEAEEEGEKKKEGWSASREERQALLKRRRDEMILAARRKMEARIEAEKEGGPSRVAES